MSAHTPAPWTVSGKQIKAIDHGKRYTVATANNPKFTPEGNAANGRLIAAAPTMLETLRNIVACCNANDADSMANAIADARAAIAKATGATA